MAILAIIGIGISLYLIYATFMEVHEAKNKLESEDEVKREEAISLYRTYAIAGICCLVTEIVALLISGNIISGILSFGCFAVCANCLYRLFDDEDTRNITKKDSDVLKDFLKNAEKDAKNKSK